MRDAASAAAMSDPENNRWFRRRWAEVPLIKRDLPRRFTPQQPALDLLGSRLLADWRRGRVTPTDLAP